MHQCVLIAVKKHYSYQKEHEDIKLKK